MVFTVLGCVAVCQPASHGDSENFELVYSLGGECTDVVVDGPLAYAVGGGSLKILDVSSPAAPEILSTRPTTGDRSAQVAVADGCAYVLAGTSIMKMLGAVVLDILNVEDPADPVLLGSHSLQNDTVGGIAVSGSYAYATVSFSGLLGGSSPGGLACGGHLKVLDISDPTVYNEVGAFEFGSLVPFRVVVADGVAFICALCLWDGYLRFFDVSEPGDPVDLGSYHAAGAVTGVDLVGDVAYLSWTVSTTSRGGVEIVDIADLEAPVQLGVQDFNWAAMHVRVRNSLAFVATMNGGLRAADVQVPEAMAPAGSYDTSGMGIGVALAGGLVYLASEDALSILRYTGAGPGEFTEQPRGGWFEVGEPLELCVGLSGTVEPVTYEWRKDGQPLAGGTDSCYTVDALTQVDEGRYVCRVADNAKAVYESDPAHVQVFAAGSLPGLGAVGLAIAGSLLAGWVVVRARKEAR